MDEVCKISPGTKLWSARPRAATRPAPTRYGETRRNASDLLSRTPPGQPRNTAHTAGATRLRPMHPPTGRVRASGERCPGRGRLPGTPLPGARPGPARGLLPAGARKPELPLEPLPVQHLSRRRAAGLLRESAPEQPKAPGPRRSGTRRRRAEPAIERAGSSPAARCEWRATAPRARDRCPTRAGGRSSAPGSWTGWASGSPSRARRWRAPRSP